MLLKLKLGVLLISLLTLTGCVDGSGTVKNFKVSSIKKNICIEDKCSYTISGTVDVMNAQYKSDKEIASLLEEGITVDIIIEKDVIKEIITY